jgi:hypothetical protein
MPGAGGSIARPASAPNLERPDAPPGGTNLPNSPILLKASPFRCPMKAEVPKCSHRMKVGSAIQPQWSIRNGCHALLRNAAF